MRWLPLALLLAPAASAQSPLPARPGVADRLDDLRLATAVRLALVGDVRTRALDVRVAARDGGVEVRGDVPASQARTVAEVAYAVPGVRVVGGLPGLADQGARPAATARPDPARLDAPAERPAPAAEAGERRFHTVERGDTLFSLARRYGTDVQAILRLNGMEAPAIRVGQRLRVR